MVPGMTERERRMADVVRLEWLADAQNGPARKHVVSRRQNNPDGPPRDLLPRGRFRGLWPALALRRLPRLAQTGTVERALG